jgi:DNA-directed RNA polymerase alpha subunit
MSTVRFRNEVLNPCPTCGKQFDIGGCMTFMDLFLQEAHAGKCPNCGTQVVIQVEERYQPEIWEKAESLSQIRSIAIADLWLSVRTSRSLEQIGIATIGQLLDSTEAEIRQGLLVSNSVIDEIRRLLSTKGLSMKA